MFLDFWYGTTMNQRVKLICDEASALSAEDRIELIEQLQASLDPVDPSIEQAWVEASEQRLDGYLRGEIEARDADEVLAKYLKP